MGKGNGLKWAVHWLLAVRFREDYFRARNEKLQKNMLAKAPVASYRLLLEFLLARGDSHFLHAKKRKNSTSRVLNNLDADYAFTEIFSASA